MEEEDNIIIRTFSKNVVLLKERTFKRRYFEKNVRGVKGNFVKGRSLKGRFWVYSLSTVVKRTVFLKWSETSFFNPLSLLEDKNEERNMISFSNWH